MSIKAHRVRRVGGRALTQLPDQTFPHSINGVTIHQGNCCDVLAGIGAETVDLIITSPPYNVGVDYDGYDDARPWDEYASFCSAWLAACYRVLTPDGRLCLNVPLDTLTHPRFGSWMADRGEQCSFRLKTTIVWNEQNINKRTAWGSWKSASAPHIIAPIELIFVFYKERWKKLRRGTSTVTSDEFKAWAGAGGVWTFSGQRRGPTPATFPVELPRRCLKLFSYVDDLVLDPFAGSGTTGVAAMELGRRCVLIEQSRSYCQEIARRFRDLI